MEEERKQNFFFKSEETVGQLSESIRKATIRIMGIPEREKGAENTF